MKEDFVIDWLKNYFNMTKLDEKEIKPILHFSLLWNLFEHTYFTDKNPLSVEKLLTLAEASSAELSNDQVNKTFSYFKKRFLANGHIDNIKFNSLNLSAKNSAFCESVLLNDDPSSLMKVKCIFLLIHRYRNNLFHGRKTPTQLNLYKTPFEQINLFLIHFFDKTTDNQRINKLK